MLDSGELKGRRENDEGRLNDEEFITRRAGASKKRLFSRYSCMKTTAITFRSDEEKKKFVMWSAVKVGIGGGLGGLLFGYDLGVIAGALSGIANEFSLSVTEEEYVVSMLLVGAIVGSLLGGYV